MKPRLTLTFTEDFVSQCLERKQDFNNNNNNANNNPIQLICASATVGRTLRRQLMDMTRASSMDKAATLVTADVRTKKDADARKASLLPKTLSHCYHVVEYDEDNNNNNNDSTSKDVKAAILADLATNVFCTTDNDDDDEGGGLKPGVTLLFPGRIGVERVQETLRSNGFQQIRGLEDIEQQQQQSSSKNNNQSGDWKDTPIYVVNEKVSRGLDLEGIVYVVMLQVPKSPAGYTHLAGRTGRNGSTGTALTLCQPTEAPKLKVIADTLRLKMLDVVSNAAAVVDDTATLETSTASIPTSDVVAVVDEADEEVEEVEEEEEPAVQEDDDDDDDDDQQLPSWSSLSESALKRKTVTEITEYLSQHDIVVSGEDGKKPKKTDLLQAVQEFHNES